MPQSLAKCYMHIVFSTKGRANLIPKAHLDKVHAYITGILNSIHCPGICVGGTENHIHILCIMSRSITISNLVKTVKASSSKWINEQQRDFHHFAWQEGYGCFTISQTHVDAVKQYIAIQEEHHQHVTFQDEFRRLLEIYQVEYDERYVWD